MDFIANPSSSSAGLYRVFSWNIFRGFGQPFKKVKKWYSQNMWSIIGTNRYFSCEHRALLSLVPSHATNICLAVLVTNSQTLYQSLRQKLCHDCNLLPYIPGVCHIKLLRLVKGPSTTLWSMAESRDVSEVVKLQSSEGKIFEVPMEVAKVFRTLSIMLQGKIHGCVVLYCFFCCWCCSCHFSSPLTMLMCVCVCVIKIWGTILMTSYHCPMWNLAFWKE